MRWTKTDDGWRRRFAFLPFRVSDGPTQTWVWWEWYGAREEGLYTAIRLLSPGAEYRRAIDRPE